jgi:hypothetical protein
MEKKLTLKQQKEQKDYEELCLFIGKFMQHFILLENEIERAIVYFFYCPERPIGTLHLKKGTIPKKNNVNNVENYNFAIETIIKHHIFPDTIRSFKAKVDIFKSILKISDADLYRKISKNTGKFNYFELITNIAFLRNVLAHRYIMIHTKSRKYMGVKFTIYDQKTVSNPAGGFQGSFTINQIKKSDKPYILNQLEDSISFIRTVAGANTYINKNISPKMLSEKRKCLEDIIHKSTKFKKKGVFALEYKARG